MSLEINSCHPSVTSKKIFTCCTAEPGLCTVLLVIGSNEPRDMEAFIMILNNLMVLIRQHNGEDLRFYPIHFLFVGKWHFIVD
jgi:hypothetical protein